MGKKSNSTNLYSTSADSVPTPTVEIDTNRIIFRHKVSTTDEDKALLRQKYNVTNFRTCSCGDKNLELWGLNTNDLVVAENAVRGLKEQEKPRGEGEGGYQFTFPLPIAENFRPLDCNFSEDVCILGKDDTKVNIAVLDTGINLSYFNDSPFLYNTSGLGNCPGYVGWNFSGEGSFDVLDDNGHGTYVTKIITETLRTKGIGYRILPLKVLDSEGKGSFWNLLCALSYLQKIQKEGANIHLVNASLGGTMAKEYFQDSDLFNTMVQELESDNILVVTSAGNDGVDTDSGNIRHFSSSYKAENILAVGGHFKDAEGKLEVHPKSNFGEQSIDLAAPYEIEVADLPVAILEGTSFSTAYVTALAGEFYMNHGKPKPLVLKSGFLGTASIENGLGNKINGNRAIIG